MLNNGFYVIEDFWVEYKLNKKNKIKFCWAELQLLKIRDIKAIKTVNMTTWKKKKMFDQFLVITFY